MGLPESKSAQKRAQSSFSSPRPAFKYYLAKPKMPHMEAADKDAGAKRSSSSPAFFLSFGHVQDLLCSVLLPQAVQGRFVHEVFQQIRAMEEHIPRGCSPPMGVEPCRGPACLAKVSPFACKELLP